MFESIPTEMIMGLATGIGGFLAKRAAQEMQNKKDMFEMAMKQNQAASEQADAAAKRSSPIARKAISFIIIGTFCLGLFIAMFMPNTPVSFIQESPQKEFLYGLFKWGKTFEVVEVQGFFQSDLLRYCVVSVIGFFLGTGASKVK